MKSRTGDYEPMNPEALMAGEAKKVIGFGSGIYSSVEMVGAGREPATIDQVADGEGIFPPADSGHAALATVLIRMEPGQKGTGVFVISETAAGSIPVEFLPHVRQGILIGLKLGRTMDQMMSLLAMNPVTDVTVRILGGSIHEESLPSHLADMREMAFQMAGMFAVGAVLKKVGRVPSK